MVDSKTRHACVSVYQSRAWLRVLFKTQARTFRSNDTVGKGYSRRNGTGNRVPRARLSRGEAILRAEVKIELIFLPFPSTAPS